MLKPVKITVGCDPEGFFERGGAIIGSEKVLPQRGLISKGTWKSDVVLDGVQFELNPSATQTGAELGGCIAKSMFTLREHLKSLPDITCCWRGTVEVGRSELDSLSPKSRVLGCAPSKNIYGHKPLTINPETYQKRSAGGHLHLGLKNNTKVHSHVSDERSRLVPLLDIFVGNTMVLLDRDPGAIERRENYGRAGEYRLPNHGLEYRTPSNCWLRSYALLSLILGLAQIAISTLDTTLEGKNDLEQELVDVVEIDNFVQAINTNNYDLARANFNVVRPFLAKHLGWEGFQLTPSTLDKFLDFADSVRLHGLETYFKDDPLTHWCKNEFTEFSTFLKEL